MSVDVGAVAALLGALGSGGFLGALWQRRNQEALFRLQVDEARRTRAEDRAEQAGVRAEELREERAARFAEVRRDAYVGVLGHVRDFDAALTSLGFAHARYVRLEERAVTHVGTDNPAVHRERVAAAREELDDALALVVGVARQVAAAHVAIELVAPPDVRRAAARLRSTVDELAAAAESAAGGDHVAVLRAAVEEFVETARGDVAP